jgi:cell wall-associated NlpC family hydrolase
MKRLCLIVFFLAVFAAGNVCHADIYGFKDDAGVLHLTNIPPGKKEYRTVVYADKRSERNFAGFRSRQPWSRNKEDLIGLAKTYLGSPYKLGGNLPTGIDCSGFVKQVYSEFNVQLPRTARQQFLEGTRVDKDDLTTGDLIFFRTKKSNDPAHVGIFIDEDKFIHASTRNGGGVRIDSLADQYYSRAFMGASRLIR